MAVCLPIAIAAMPLAARAEDEWAPKSYVDGCVRKLGRGAANMLTGPLELIRKPALVGRKEGGIASLTVGLAQGFLALASREGAGALEIATFWTPFPTGFRPLVKPEFIWANGEWVE